jgi:hypothetical protein
MLWCRHRQTCLWEMGSGHTPRVRSRETALHSFLWSSTGSSRHVVTVSLGSFDRCWELVFCCLLILGVSEAPSVELERFLPQSRLRRRVRTSTTSASSLLCEITIAGTIHPEMIYSVSFKAQCVVALMYLFAERVVVASSHLRRFVYRKDEPASVMSRGL